MQSQQYQTKTKAIQQKMLEQTQQILKPKFLQKKSQKKQSQKARHLLENQEKLINQRKDQQNKKRKQRRLDTKNLVQRTSTKSEQIHTKIKKKSQIESDQSEYDQRKKLAEHCFQKLSQAQKALEQAFAQCELRKKKFDQAEERKDVNLENTKYAWERAQKTRSDALKNKELSYQSYLNSKKDFEDYRKMMMKKKRY